MTALSEFQALKTLIVSSLDRYEAALGAGGISEPHLAAAKPHESMDAPGYLPSHELYDTTNTLVSALGQMRALVMSPADRLIKTTLSAYTIESIRIVVLLNITDVIAKLDTGDGVPVDKIAAEAKVHPMRLAKPLRLLANQYIYREVREGVFANNRSSLYLSASHPVRAYIEFTTWHVTRRGDTLFQSWTDPALTNSFDPRKSVTSRALGMDPDKYESFWPFLAEREPEIVELFSRGMTGAALASVPGTLADYPWDKLPQDSTVVDVGGGRGSLLLEILRAHPHLKGVVQDREEVVPLARSYFSSTLPEANVEFDVIDFLKQQQPRSGPNHVYVLRWIIHDWPDNLCRDILNGIKKQMRSDSRILIVDTVLNPAVPSETQAPLLQSGGEAGEFSLYLDMEMLSALEATERSASQFQDLCASVGLELEKIYKTRSNLSIISVRLPS